MKKFSIPSAETITRSRTATFLLAVALVACTHVPADQAGDALQQARPDRVVLVSFDGVAADILSSMHARGVVSNDGIMRLKREGTAAERMVPVNPTVTAVTHISMITGARPETTGIVSNTFHMPGTPRTARTSGFSAAIEADTLWLAARRQGKSVGAITYPGLDAASGERSADWGLVYVHAASPSRLVPLSRDDFSEEWVPPGWKIRREVHSYSPPRTARLTWELKVDEKEWGYGLNLIALDRTNDAVENYDSFEVMYNGARISPDPKGWFPVVREVTQRDGSTRRYGSWSKIISFTPSLDRVVVYLGAIHANEGYPDSFRRMIDEEVGFWPGEPDSRSAEAWLAAEEGIDPETFSEQVSRFSDFFTEATIVAIERMPFDLLLSYQPIVDETGHTFLISSGRQQPKRDGAREVAARTVDHAYATFDRAVERMHGRLRESDALVIVSDHGMAPMDTTVRVNRLLADWGYAEANGGRMAEDTAWAAFTSGSMAHIYQFEERRKGEIDRLVEQLELVTAPDGQRVFERIEKKPSTGESRQGDIVAYAFPRFGLDPSLRSPAIVASTHFGQHGGLNHHPELHAIFFAAGRGVPKRTITAIEQTAVARFVSDLLGIDPPAQAE